MVGSSREKVEECERLIVSTVFVDLCLWLCFSLMGKRERAHPVVHPASVSPTTMRMRALQTNVMPAHLGSVNSNSRRF